MKYDYDDLFPAVKTRMNKLALVAVAHTYGEAGRDDATDRWNAICFDHGTKLAAVVRVHDGGTAEYRVVMCVDVPSMYGGVDDCRVFLLDDAIGGRYVQRYERTGRRLSRRCAGAWRCERDADHRR